MLPVLEPMLALAAAPFDAAAYSSGTLKRGFHDPRRPAPVPRAPRYLDHMRSPTMLVSSTASTIRVTTT